MYIHSIILPIIIKFTAVLTAFLAFFSLNADAQLYGSMFDYGNQPYPYLADPYGTQVYNNWRTTGNRSRLVHVADGFYKNGSFPASSDSMTFTYWNHRGWDTVVNEWAYDEHKGIWKDLRKTYGTDGRLLMTSFTINPATQYRTTFTYNADGKRASQTYEKSTNGSWSVETSYSFSYDSLGRAIRFVGQADSTIHIYDSNGLAAEERYVLRNGAMDINNAWYITYSNGRISERVYKSSNGIGTVAESQKEIIEYDGNGRAITYYIIEPARTFVRADTSKHTYTYDADGYITTILKQHRDYGKDSNEEKVEIAYNYLHQVVSEKYMYDSKNTGNWQYYNEKRYHYATLFPTGTSIISRMAQPDVKLYPIPSDGQINVLINGVAGICQITALRIDGTLLQKWLVDVPGDNFRQELDLVDIPPGNYLLRIEANNFLSTKQITLR